jgi:hypothetical protein
MLASNQSKGATSMRVTAQEQQLLDAGWQVEDNANDRHALRKGGPATYRIYIPPDYRRPGGSPIAWTLDDALERGNLR